MGLNNRLWRSIRNGARARQINFALTKSQALALFDGRCAMSGVPIQIATTSAGQGRGETTASLDRINSSRGYTPDNVQWVHIEVNRMKNTLGKATFVQWCRRVAKHCD